MSRYYDKEGNPINEMMEWAKKFEDADYKRVSLDQVGDKEVSTVWLGLDHALGETGPPLIFETMVFGDDGEEDCRRYSTMHEAEQGHAEVVARLRGGDDG